MGRWFNTAGPCLPDYHYMIPPLRRLPQATELIARMGYFVLHAPRQTGKTTVIRALADDLTVTGKYAALTFSCELAEAAGDDYGSAQRGLLNEIRLRANATLPPELRPPPWPEAPADNLLRASLAAWAAVCPRPLVLFLDEIDALRGQSLISVLRQLRAGYNERPAGFPASVILCGLRDVRDYKAASGGDPTRLGTSSPFNIKVASLRLGDFTPAEVRELYQQHTEVSGQEFTNEAIARTAELTGGQPWLVNALAHEVVDEMGVPPTEPVTISHVEEAKERLVFARATHLDSLAAKLVEPRVRRVIEPILAGTLAQFDPYDDDLRYTRDLGLVTRDYPLQIANPLYREVIVRVMGNGVEANVVADPRSFVRSDGRLDFARLLREFAQFWREHGEVLAAGMVYHEAAPQLVLMAFLHRLVNGGGYIDREYGIGRGRIDLLVRWPYQDAAAKRQWQREALELKVWRDGEADPLSQGLTQLDGYLERLGLDSGVLVLFDRRSTAAPIVARTAFSEVISPGGRRITVLRG